MSANNLPPYGGSNPCLDCRHGVCHRCGVERADATLAPHMGVILCRGCFVAKLIPTTEADDAPSFVVSHVTAAEIESVAHTGTVYGEGVRMPPLDDGEAD